MKILPPLFESSVQKLGGKIDFILHSIGMSVNVRKKRQYYDQNYDWTSKGIDVSAMSFHKMIQAAWKLDAINEWGSIVGLSYIAAQRVFNSYNDMADNKAFLESIARSFGYHYGVRRNVRINTISQSPTLTTAGSGVSGFDTFYNYANDLSHLGMHQQMIVQCIVYHYSLIIQEKLPCRTYFMMEVFLLQG